MSENNLEPPKKSTGDHSLTAVRAAIAAIPMAGGAAIELFNALITPPLEKRKSEWMESVATELQRLTQENRITLENIVNNDLFIDAMLEASQVALKTSSADKKLALKNAVVNTVLPNPPDESLQKIYIRLIDELTEWHIKLLALFDAPEAWFHQQGLKPPEFVITSSLSALLHKAFPELQGRRDFYDYIAKDLYNKGLFASESLHGNMSTTGAFQSRSTELGKGFLSFIKEQ